MQSILDPKWLLFVKVSELASLTRAAASLDMPQSMVSRHVAQLETECGARLFRRTGRGVVLTEFGQQIFPRIKAMIATADELADDIQSSGGVPVGEVRIGLLPSIVPLLAGRLFKAVHEKFPKVRLHLTEGASSQLAEHVHEGRLDMSLLLREEEEGDFAGEHAAVLTRLPLYLVGPRNDPLTRRKSIAFDELQGLPLILPGSPHPLRARVDRLAQARKLDLIIAVEADSIRLQHEIAASGGGYAITVGSPGAVNELRLSEARIVKPQLIRAIILETSLRRPHTLATREVYRLLLQLTPDVLKS